MRKKASSTTTHEDLRFHALVYGAGIADFARGSEDVRPGNVGMVFVDAGGRKVTVAGEAAQFAHAVKVAAETFGNVLTAEQRAIPIPDGTDPFLVNGAVETRAPYRLTDGGGVVAYEAGWGSTTVLVDVVAESTVDQSRVHILVPASKNDLTTINFAEALANEVRRLDPDALGLVVVWPNGESLMNDIAGPGAVASVYTFGRVEPVASGGGGKASPQKSTGTLNAGDDSVAVQHVGPRRGGFADPSWGDLRPDKSRALLPVGFPDLDSWDDVEALIDTLDLRADVDRLHQQSDRGMKETDADVSRFVDGW